MWWPSKNGLYSVKTAYYFFVNKIVDTSPYYKDGNRKVSKVLSVGLGRLLGSGAAVFLS